MTCFASILKIQKHANSDGQCTLLARKRALRTAKSCSTYALTLSENDKKTFEHF